MMGCGWTAVPAQESVIFHNDFTTGGTQLWLGSASVWSAGGRRGPPSSPAPARGHMSRHSLRQLTSRWLWLLQAVLGICSGAAAAAMPSFPGAEGFGGTFAGSMPATGWFTGGSVYHVTTTEDLVDSGGRPLQGTLRGAFWNYASPTQPKQNAANRVVVFDVGGVFQLTQGSLDIKTVDCIYVAGQTAPTPVTVYGNTTQITKSSNTVTKNVILRYMTFRKGSGDGEDAITFSGGSGTGSIASNMILDHVSASWAEDENLSVTNNNTNVTVQYSIISDALTSSHAYASLIRPQVDASVTFHHNLYANNASRQPRLGSYNTPTLTMDFVNNVISNWRDRAGYAGGSSEPEQEYVDLNYVSNMLVAGPGTVASRTTAFWIDRNVDVAAYQSGNAIDSSGALNPDGSPQAVNTGWGMFAVNSSGGDQTLVKLTAPAFPATTVPQSAGAAYRQVLDYVGNSWWERDPIDTRVIDGVVTNSGPTSIGQAEPNPAELAALLATPTVARPAGYDTDRDGMPNDWEIRMGLDPYDPADAWYDYDDDKYLNVTEYLNEVGAIPATIPLRFTNANGTGRYEEIGNWQTGVWEPSRFDAAVIDAGTVTVNSIGQYARTLSVAAAGGGTARLELTAGWLEVNEAVTLGSGGSLSLTGGHLLGAPAVTVTAGGSLSLPSTARSMLDVGRLSIAETAGGGRLDLGAGEVNVAPGGITAAALRADLLAGRNGGGWNGTAGITSTAAAAAGGTRAVGYVIGSDGAARISFAAPGDVDLTGTVDVFDLVGINGAGTYATGLPSAWSQGDFNYDGVTTVFDLVAIGSSGVYGRGNYFPAAGPTAAAVPEPGLSYLLAVAAGFTFLDVIRRKQYCRARQRSA